MAIFAAGSSHRTAHRLRAAEASCCAWRARHLCHHRSHVWHRRRSGWSVNLGSASRKNRLLCAFFYAHCALYGNIFRASIAGASFSCRRMIDNGVGDDSIVASTRIFLFFICRGRGSAWRDIRRDHNGQSGRKGRDRKENWACYQARGSGLFSRMLLAAWYIWLDDSLRRIILLRSRACCAWWQWYRDNGLHLLHLRTVA